MSRIYASYESVQRRARLLPALVARAGEFRATLALWHTRVRYRHALAQMSEREMADIGVNWLQVVEEVNKPFWRA